MPGVHFITFANTSYTKPDRILEQARSFNIFTSIKALNEHDIPEYISQHSEFIQRYKEGYGRFIWKPKIIFDKLLSMDDNDILLYCDAGCHLNVQGISRFVDYLKLFETKHVLAFLTTKEYEVNKFVKKDAIMSYFPELSERMYQYMYAGVVFLKKTPYSMRMIHDWLTLCQTYNFLDQSKSVKYTDPPYFIGQDTDNGLFALCVYKFQRIVKFIQPNEINIYNPDGTQNYNCTDWSSLDRFPIQYRRDRPKHGQTNAISNDTIPLTRPSNDTCLSQPSSFSAFVGSPIKISTSEGLQYFLSVSTSSLPVTSS